MTVRIVTDSACDLSPAEAEALGIEVVPLSIRFGDDELTDRVQLTPEQFYERMAGSDALPETAAPSPGSFEQAFRRQAERGASDVVCINISGELSATGQAARAAATAISDDIPVHCVDSQSVSVGLGTLAVRAAEAANDGGSAADIVGMVEDLRGRLHVLGILDTLDNLKKGGRIGNAQAMLGSMLSIKPCIDISTGVVEEAGRQRTRKKALGWLRESLIAAGGVSNIAIGHGLADDFEGFWTSLGGDVDLDSARKGIIGPVIGTHGGPRVIGLSWTDN